MLEQLIACSEELSRQVDEQSRRVENSCEKRIQAMETYVVCVYVCCQSKTHDIVRFISWPMSCISTLKRLCTGMIRNSREHIRIIYMYYYISIPFVCDPLTQTETELH